MRLAQAACALALGAVLANAAAAQGLADGPSLFTRCAACHLPDGAGVPGAFPALRAQIGRYAADPAGRTYLVSVVTHGLMGPLTAGGVGYAGFMPAQNLSDAEAAVLLNHLVSVIAAPAVKVPDFTTLEIGALRKGCEAAGAQESRALRPDALGTAP